MNFFVNFNAAFVPFLPNNLTVAFRANFVAALRCAGATLPPGPRLPAFLPPPLFPALPPESIIIPPTPTSAVNTLSNAPSNFKNASTAS